MKRCPTCQRTYPDNAPDACPYDGTFVVSEASPQQPYYPGAQPQPPYGAPPTYGAPPPTGDPSQWQQQQGGYYQQPGGPYPPPYGGPYAPTSGGGLSKAALFTGIGAISTLALGYIMALIGANSLSISLIQLGGLLILLAAVAGLAAVVLGIVVIAMAGKNPAVNKAHGIIGLVLGIIPIIVLIFSIVNASSARYRY